MTVVIFDAKHHQNTKYTSLVLIVLILLVQKNSSFEKRTDEQTETYTGTARGKDVTKKARKNHPKTLIETTIFYQIPPKTSSKFHKIKICITVCNLILWPSTMKGDGHLKVFDVHDNFTSAMVLR